MIEHSRWVLIAPALVLLGCRSLSTADGGPSPPEAGARAEAPAETAAAEPRPAAAAPSPVGADPGHAGRGTPLAPLPGHELAAFVTPIGPFYKAEGYHQQYAEKTGHHGCALPGGVEGI